MNPKLSFARRIKAAFTAVCFYGFWYPRQWLPSLGRLPKDAMLAGHMMYVRRNTKRLARSLFHAMVRHGQKLEKKQRLLFRFVDIGIEIFVMAVTCARAEAMLKKDASSKGPRDLANLFCLEARERIKDHFRKTRTNRDTLSYTVGRRTLAGKYAWLENNIIE